MNKKYTLKELEFDRANLKCYTCRKGFHKWRNYHKHNKLVHGVPIP